MRAERTFSFPHSSECGYRRNKQVTLNAFILHLKRTHKINIPKDPQEQHLPVPEEGEVHDDSSLGSTPTLTPSPKGGIY